MGFKRDFGCIMIQFTIPNWGDMFKLLGCDPNDVYDTPENDYGIETEPHVTLLYGIHDDEHSINDVKYHLPALEDMSAIIIGLSHFDCPEYDVLKLDIDAPKYYEVNLELRKNLQHTCAYPDYHPHMAVAYVKKGIGGIYSEKYKNRIIQAVIKPSKYKYGFQNGTDEYFTI